MFTTLTSTRQQDLSAGDKERLYRAHRPAIYARCKRVLGEDHAAEDATQDTFVRAFRHIATAPAAHAARSWLLTIATNCCLNELRHRQVRRHVPLDTVTLAEDRSPQQHIDQDLARRIINSVPPRWGQVAYLHHLAGFDQQSVGTMLGVSRRTVVSCLTNLKHRARNLTSTGP
jgi:RNA polymerase sigma factor (sigma-70 family)